MKKGDKAPIVTQWDMNRVEQNGLLKIDFLGLRNLGVIDMAEQLINERHPGANVDCYNLQLEEQPFYQELCGVLQKSLG
jgi:DNA polymerase-3 subunit alpha